MKFSRLAYYFSLLEENTSRLKITDILAKLFKEASTKEADKICYLALGRLAPLYSGIEFNLAEKMMIKAIALAYEADENMVKREFKSEGDLGNTAFHFAKGEHPRMPSLLSENVDRAKSVNGDFSVAYVHESLLGIARESGGGSVERKIGKMARLISGLDPLSVKYVVRVPLGRLRLGFSDATILDALSWALVGNKSKRKELEDAYDVRADVGQVAQLCLEKGLKGLKKISLRLGTPVMPALCQRIPTAEEMIEKMGKVAVEPKYDGTRAQLHFDKEKKFVRIFTRNLEDVTHMFPDVVQAVGGLKAKKAVLDGEIIGYDPKTGKFLPFQETIKRKRKHQVLETSKEIPLKYMCFDVIYYDGKDLINTPLSERRKLLQKIMPSLKKTIMISPQIVTEDPRELRLYHEKQVNEGLEGVVIKKWLSPYDPGRRGFTWVKYKQEKGKKGGGLADTLDCVVMGYVKGKGKRAGFGIGAFLVGIKESASIDRYLTISKIGTGLSDEQWREMRRRCEEVKTDVEPKEYNIGKNLEPDVFTSPRIVVEVEADNITRSPTHTAGLALRFPRLVRFRDDKSPEGCTTLAEAHRLYKLQK